MPSKQMTRRKRDRRVVRVWKVREPDSSGFRCPAGLDDLLDDERVGGEYVLGAPGDRQGVGGESPLR